MRLIMIMCLSTVALMTSACGGDRHPPAALDIVHTAALQPLIADTSPPGDGAWENDVTTRLESFEAEYVNTLLGRMREGAVGLIRGAPTLYVRFGGKVTGPTSYDATETRELAFHIDYSLMDPEHVLNEHMSFTAGGQSWGDAEATLRKYCTRSCRESDVNPAWFGKNCRPVGDVHREPDHYWQLCQVWEHRPDSCRARGGASVHPVPGCDYHHATVQGRYVSTFSCKLEDSWHCTVGTTATCATHDEDLASFTARKDFCHYLAAALWERDSADVVPGADLSHQQVRRRKLEGLLDELYAP